MSSCIDFYIWGQLFSSWGQGCYRSEKCHVVRWESLPMAHHLPSAGTALSWEESADPVCASCLFVVHVRALQLLIDGGWCANRSELILPHEINCIGSWYLGLISGNVLATAMREVRTCCIWEFVKKLGRRYSGYSKTLLRYQINLSWKLVFGHVFEVPHVDHMWVKLDPKRLYLWIFL